MQSFMAFQAQKKSFLSMADIHQLPQHRKDFLLQCYPGSYKIFFSWSTAFWVVAQLVARRMTVFFLSYFSQ